MDNSGTATQGRIYAFPEFASQVTVYKPGGKVDESVKIAAQGDDCGATVGPDGHLWISVFHFGAFEYLPNGEKTGRLFTPQKARWEGEQTIPLCDFAIDSQGNFYARKATRVGMSRNTTRTASFQYALGSGSSSVVAVDRRDDSVYVDDGNKVEEYSSNGSLLDDFAMPESSSAPCPGVVEEAGECYDGIQQSKGIAVDETSGDVYVTNDSYGSQRIDIFKPGSPTDRGRRHHRESGPDPDDRAPAGDPQPRRRRHDRLQIRMGCGFLRRLRTRSPLRRGRFLQRLRRPPRDG